MVLLLIITIFFWNLHHTRSCSLRITLTAPDGAVLERRALTLAPGQLCRCAGWILRGVSKGNPGTSIGFYRTPGVFSCFVLCLPRFSPFFSKPMVSCQFWVTPPSNVGMMQQQLALGARWVTPTLSQRNAPTRPFAKGRQHQQKLV